MNALLDIFDRLSKTLLETLKRFPLASFSAFLVSIIWVVLMEIDEGKTNAMVLLANKLAFVLTLGVFLFPLLHLLNRSYFFKLLGIVLLSLYFYFLPLEIDILTVLRHLLLIFALVLMFFWAPFFNTDISNKNIWEWTMKILLILFATFILTVTIYGVFYLFFFSLEELFGITLLAKRYLQFMILVLGFFSVNFFLSQLPKYIFLLQLKKYTPVGKVFTQYILTPITILYMLVLFAYIFKMFFYGLWDRVTIDWMIIGFTFLAIITYLFWTPLLEEVEHEFKNLIWGALFVLSVVLALSLWVRLYQGVGFELLYLLILFDVWLGLISLYFLLFEKASYKWLFFSISVGIGISQSDYVIDFLLKLANANL